MSTTVQDNIAVYDSRIQYLESLEALGVKFQDPRNIDELIEAKKDLYSKLKFQYLEQETKEKFLRLIIDNKPIYIEEKNLQESIVQNETLKDELKKSKTQNEEMLAELSAEVDIVCKGAKDLLELSRSNQDLMTDILDLNDKINEMTEVTTTKEKEFNMEIDDTIIVTINQHKQNPDLSSSISVANSIPALQEIKEHKQGEVEALESKVNNKKEENRIINVQIEANSQKLEELEQRKISMQHDLKLAIEARSNQLSETNRNHLEFQELEFKGKKLASMLSILTNVIPYRVEVHEITEAGLISMSINDIVVHLQYFPDGRSRCFEILSIQDMDLEDNFIERCNMENDCLGYLVKHKFS